MAASSSSNVENLPPHVLRTVSRQMLALRSQPPDGVQIHMNSDDLSDIQVTIKGPEQTPYSSGYFRLKLILGPEFPATPPKSYFLTKIFHPNVSPTTGEICVNALKKDWNSGVGLAHIFLVIKCLLIEPNPSSALNEEAGKLLLENYDEFVERAKLMTEIHATRKDSTMKDEEGNNASMKSTSIEGTKKRGAQEEQKRRENKKKLLKRL